MPFCRRLWAGRGNKASVGRFPSISTQGGHTMADSLRINDEDNKLVIALHSNPFSKEKDSYIGNRLKVAGENSGLFLCPADKDGNISKDGTDWIQVEKAQFSFNKPKRLEFFIPDGTPPGSYRITLKTSYGCNGRDLKTAISTVSKVIDIVS